MAVMEDDDGRPAAAAPDEHLPDSGLYKVTPNSSHVISPANRLRHDTLLRRIFHPVDVAVELWG